MVGIKESDDAADIALVLFLRTYLLFPRSTVNYSIISTSIIQKFFLTYPLVLHPL